MTDSKPQQILVTGGGGFLGSAIVGKLIRRGETVSSFSRRHYAELESSGVRQIQGDLSDTQAVDKAVQGMDVVFHVAAKAGVWGHYNDYFRTNVEGTRNIIAACKKHRVPRLLYTSTPSVVFNGRDMEGVNETVHYPPVFQTHYAKTKAMAEQEIAAASRDGLRVIILRPHLIWGPNDPHFTPRIMARSKKLARVGRKKNLVDTVYIENAADAHILAADKLAENPDLSGKIYFISNDDPVPIWDVINGILRAGGKPPVTKVLPRQLVWFVGATLEFLYKTLHISGEPRITRFVAEELACAHWFDISAAKTDLGYRPRISIQEGMRHLEHWLKSKPPLAA